MISAIAKSFDFILQDRQTNELSSLIYEKVLSENSSFPDTRMFSRFSLAELCSGKVAVFAPETSIQYWLHHIAQQTNGCELRILDERYQPTLTLTLTLRRSMNPEIRKYISHVYVLEVSEEARGPQSR